MQIYISSTFEDLKAFREAVYRNLRSMRLDVVAMEDYVATDRRPLDECLRDVANADVYIGIFAWRYGYVPVHDNPEKRSITELEYRKAQELGKQCLIFLLAEDAPWPPGLMDAYTGEGDDANRIRQLREELGERHIVGFFKSADELSRGVGAAVFRLVNELRLPPTETAAPDTAVRETRPRSDGPSATPRDDYPKLWTSGDTLRVMFLDGDDKQRGLVRRFVPIWTAYANLQFEFIDNPEAEIKVSFAGQGSWSYIGSDALIAEKDSPTVNFGWLAGNVSLKEAERTILHEFGHVLGMVHEHQIARADIPWDRDKVYKYFEGPPNYWSRAQVDATMFSRWSADLFPIDKPFDLESIMLYTFPNDLFTDKDYRIGVNSTISSGDKEFVAQIYPYD